MLAANDVFLAGWAEGWRPDPLLSVPDWSDANIILTSKDGPEPGPYRTSRTPYVRGIGDCLSVTSPFETVIWIAGAQVAKTRTGLNWVGSVIDNTPGPMLFVLPTVDLAKKVSKQRLGPMIEATPALRAKVAEAKSRDSGNTMFEKEFPGGMLLMTGANSAAGLRSMPIRFLYGDEIDAWPDDIDGEGDPLDLAEARTNTFARRKIFYTSTPTVKGLSKIEKAFDRSDKRFYFVPCPHCGHKQTLKWKDAAGAYCLTFKRDEHGRIIKGSVGYICEACGVIIEERHKPYMLEHGEWIPTAPGDGKTAGFHLSSLYSPLGWKSWEEIARQFLRSKDDPSKLKTFVNTVLGESYTEDGDEVDPNSLKSRLEEFPAEVPAGVGVLVAAVDVQADRLEVKVKGYGEEEESWDIAFQQIHGDPGQQDVWDDLDTFLRTEFQHESGAMMGIRAAAVDSGFQSEMVYRFCKARASRRIHAIKGDNRVAKDVLSRPSMNNRYRAKVFLVNSASAKDVIYSRLRIKRPGPGYIHLPAWADDEYLAQLTSEKCVRRYAKGRGSIREWIKTRERNEGLDLEVYCLAALYMLGRPFIASLGEKARELMQQGHQAADQAAQDEEEIPADPTKLPRVADYTSGAAPGFPGRGPGSGGWWNKS